MSRSLSLLLVFRRLSWERHQIRLPILKDTDGWLAIEKPAGVGMRAHPWDERTPDLDSALNAQLENGKPELLRLGASVFGSIYYMDPEISGLRSLRKIVSHWRHFETAMAPARGALSLLLSPGLAPMIFLSSNLMRPFCTIA